MSDADIFAKMDEDERIYAPDQVPSEAGRVLADGGEPQLDLNEPPSAAPVASIGTGSNSGMAAPPNLGHHDASTAPGDPAPVARDPLDTE